MKIAAALAGSVFLLVASCANSDVAGPGNQIPVYRMVVDVVDLTPTLAHDLVVCSDTGSVCTILTDTSNRIKRLNVNPSWNHNGDKVAYVNSTDGLNYMVIADRIDNERLTIPDFIPDDKYVPAWSTVGGFVAMKSQSENVISIFNSSGVLQTTLKSNTWFSIPGQAFWSGDGTQIVVADGANACDVFSSGGTFQRQLTNTGIIIGILPDGNSIVTYKRISADSVALKRINMLNGEQTLIRDIELKGAFSLGHIAGELHSIHFIKDGEIIAVNTSTAEITHVVAPLPIFRSSLSSDEKFIVYSTTSSPSDGYSYTVHIMGADGTNDTIVRKGMSVYFSPIIDFR